MDMKEKLQELAEAAKKRIDESEGLDKLNEVRVAYLGKKRRTDCYFKKHERCCSGGTPEGWTAGK